MSNPRVEALEAMREAERLVETIQPLVTVGALQEVKVALLRVCAAQRAVFEFTVKQQED